MVWRVAVVAFEAGFASSVMTPLMLFPDAASSWLLFLAWPSSVNTVFFISYWVTFQMEQEDCFALLAVWWNKEGKELVTRLFL